MWESECLFKRSAFSNRAVTNKKVYVIHNVKRNFIVVSVRFILIECVTSIYILGFNCHNYAPGFTLMLGFSEIELLICNRI